eukprot:GHVT01006275.1.p1 GENE.GHVT01006275.1~~GHVT01006275.1.p1  ORF type:complete len:452 (+),score=127.43 GHVT01006275.1:1098-2453(+)
MAILETTTAALTTQLPAVRRRLDAQAAQLADVSRQLRLKAEEAEVEQREQSLKGQLATKEDLLKFERRLNGCALVETAESLEATVRQLQGASDLLDSKKSVDAKLQELGDRLLASISTCATADALQKQATTFKLSVERVDRRVAVVASGVEANAAEARQALRAAIAALEAKVEVLAPEEAVEDIRIRLGEFARTTDVEAVRSLVLPRMEAGEKTVSALEQRQSVQQSALLRLDELLLDKASKFETSSMHRQILELVSQSRHRQLEQKVEEQARKLEMSLSNHRRQHSPPSLPFQQQQFRYDVDPNQVPATERMAEHVDGQAMVDPAVDFDELPNSDKPYLGSGAPSARVLSGPSSSSPSFSTAPSSSAPAATTLALISDIQRQLAMKADGVDFERLRQTAASASTAASLAAATEQNQKQLELLAQLTFRLAKLTIDRRQLPDKRNSKPLTN